MHVEVITLINLSPPERVDRISQVRSAHAVSQQSANPEHAASEALAWEHYRKEGESSRQGRPEREDDGCVLLRKALKMFLSGNRCCFPGGQRQDSARHPPADHSHQDGAEHEGSLRHQHHTASKSPLVFVVSSEIKSVVPRGLLAVASPASNERFLISSRTLWVLYPEETGTSFA
jgi:hypothetical protein